MGGEHVFSRDPTFESVIWDSPINGQAVMINQSPTSISAEQVTGDYRKIMSILNLSILSD